MTRSSRIHAHTLVGNKIEARGTSDFGPIGNYCRSTHCLGEGGTWNSHRHHHRGGNRPKRRLAAQSSRREIWRERAPFAFGQGECCLWPVAPTDAAQWWPWFSTSHPNLESLLPHISLSLHRAPSDAKPRACRRPTARTDATPPTTADHATPRRHANRALAQLSLPARPPLHPTRPRLRPL